MRKNFLPFSPPLISDEEIQEVVDTLRSEWITTGPKVARFEEEFARFVGAPGALALSSGTAALHVALLTLGIGQRDPVITTPLTFCSTVHAIEHLGARPILVDVEPDTLNWIRFGWPKLSASAAWGAGRTSEAEQPGGERESPEGQSVVRGPFFPFTFTGIHATWTLSLKLPGSPTSLWLKMRPMHCPHDTNKGASAP